MRNCWNCIDPGGAGQFPLLGLLEQRVTLEEFEFGDRLFYSCSCLALGFAAALGRVQRPAQFVLQFSRECLRPARPAGQRRPPQRLRAFALQPARQPLAPGQRRPGQRLSNAIDKRPIWIEQRIGLAQGVRPRVGPTPILTSPGQPDSHGVESPYLITVQRWGRSNGRSNPILVTM
jgi:hypothetical protein